MHELGCQCKWLIIFIIVIKSVAKWVKYQHTFV